MAKEYHQNPLYVPDDNDYMQALEFAKKVLNEPKALFEVECESFAEGITPEKSDDLRKRIMKAIDDLSRNG